MGNNPNMHLCFVIDKAHGWDNLKMHGQILLSPNFNPFVFEMPPP
jgi:hypothetical protein